MDEARSISLEGQNVDFVSRFTYLGSDIHVRDGSGPEVIRRLGRAGAAMDALDKVVWHSRFVCKVTKLKMPESHLRKVNLVRKAPRRQVQKVQEIFRMRLFQIIRKAPSRQN